MIINKIKTKKRYKRNFSICYQCQHFKVMKECSEWYSCRVRGDDEHIPDETGSLQTLLNKDIPKECPFSFEHMMANSEIEDNK